MRGILTSIAMGASIGLMLAALLLFLSGCSAIPHTETVTVEKVEICPISAPEVSCPNLGDGTVEALEDAYIDCREAARAWEESWSACGKQG